MEYECMAGLIDRIGQSLDAHAAWLTTYHVQARYVLERWETLVYHDTQDHGIRLKVRMIFESEQDLALYKLHGLESQELVGLGAKWDSLKINNLQKLISH